MPTSFESLSNAGLELLDLLPLGCFLTDESAVVTDCNEEVLQIFQLSREQIVNRPLNDLLHMSEDGQVLKFHGEKIETIQEILHGTLAGVQRVDGSLIWLRLRTRKIRGEGGDGLIVSALDVTEQRKLLDQTRTTVRDTFDLFDYFPVAAFTCDIAGKIQNANRAFEILCMGGEKHSSSSNIFEMFESSETRTNILEKFRQISNDEISEIREEVILKSTDEKNIFDAMLVVGSYRANDADQHTFIGLVENMNAFRLRDEEKMKASKFEALALLSSGIAHDLNNIMLAITANLELAGMDIKNHENVSKFVNDAMLAARRACDLAKRLMTFAKGGNPVKEVMDITSHIMSTIQFALRGSNLIPSFQVVPDLLPVEVDLSQINQVLDNLVINAREASNTGGTLEVRAINREIPEGCVEHLKPGWYVEISIRDHGVGISEENILRIFDPYFSTKTNGSGIGLSTCYSIVKRHQGIIQVTSEPGVGSVFTVLLPAAAPLDRIRREQALIAPSQEVKAVKEMGGKGRILIVDDETMILNILKSMLKSLGYDPSTASRTEEALVMYRQAMQNKTPYDAIVLDATIPGGIGGDAALREFLKIDPLARVIICSGYTNSKVMLDYEKLGFKGKLEKPFQVSELGSILKKVTTLPKS